jgi:tellurite resistance-related uncharacterized protein
MFQAFSIHVDILFQVFLELVSGLWLSQSMPAGLQFRVKSSERAEFPQLGIFNGLMLFCCPRNVLH